MQRVKYHCIAWLGISKVHVMFLLGAKDMGSKFLNMFPILFSIIKIC